MRARVTHFKTPQIALKELEPFIRDGRHLYAGKPFERFGQLRSRELLCNWLLCAVLNAGKTGAQFTFTSDPGGGDGIIYDVEGQIGYPTEHVMVPMVQSGPTPPAEALIAAAVSMKQTKGGAAYARGKILVVFLDAGLGEWMPNRAAKALPQSNFDQVWVMSLHGDVSKGYVYGVTLLDTSYVNAPTYLVHINSDFTSWTVERLQ